MYPTTGPSTLRPTLPHPSGAHPSIPLDGDGPLELGGTIRIFHNDSLLAGIAALQDQDHLVGTKKLGHLLSDGGDWLAHSMGPWGRPVKGQVAGRGPATLIGQSGQTELPRRALIGSHITVPARYRRHRDVVGGEGWRIGAPADLRSYQDAGRGRGPPRGQGTRRGRIRWPF